MSQPLPKKVLGSIGIVLFTQLYPQSKALLSASAGAATWTSDWTYGYGWDGWDVWHLGEIDGAREIGIEWEFNGIFMGLYDGDLMGFYEI